MSPLNSYSSINLVTSIPVFSLPAPYPISSLFDAFHSRICTSNSWFIFALYSGFATPFHLRRYEIPPAEHGSLAPNVREGRFILAWADAGPAHQHLQGIPSCCNQNHLHSRSPTPPSMPLSVCHTTPSVRLKQYATYFECIQLDNCLLRFYRHHATTAEQPPLHRV